ncbi:MAG: prepilin peptidase [Pirellulales bacterium]|nr:prepilin peptidase [Pirellulales bacterium]
MMLAALPLPLGLLLAAAGGLLAGAFVNWAAYALAWNQRPVSPWSAAHPSAPARRASDRVPFWGWFGLRRESAVHGRGFWIRPLAVELVMAAGWAALYWWEVDQQGLVARQFESFLQNANLSAPTWTTVATFASHALLVTLMAAASLIDIDEKTIPDGITTPGTLLALVLATVCPMSLLPHVALRQAAPVAGVEILPAAPGPQADPVALYVEPLSLTAPNAWPAALGGSPNWLSLAIGLTCFAIWIFALTHRIWRKRRGLAYGLRILFARVARDLARPPLSWIAIVGLLAITGVWFRGGAAWLGLLTALVGVIGGGAMVWAVRIVGSWALHKEAMGFGDVTLMMMIGAFLGWQPGVFIFFIAPFAGLLVGIVQMMLRRDDVIPYGPFLCLGALAVMVRWADFWNADPRALQAFFDFPWLVPGILAVGVVMLGAMLVLWRNLKEVLFGVPVED